MIGTEEKLMTVVLGVIIALAFAVILYSAYGHLTQKEIVTVLVTDKDIRTSTVQNCSSSGNTVTCIPTTITSYLVFSDGGALSISENLYGKIIVGKKHTFEVSGWHNDRYIMRVLE